MSKITDPLILPCGSRLANRLAKASMSENMAVGFKPGIEFHNAYKMWSAGGAGLLISGNVMVDRNHLGEPDNVVIEKGLDISADLKKWSSSVEGTDAKLWLQINHPGKQSPKFLNKTPVAPSAVPFANDLKVKFNPPRELTEKEIYDIIERFGYAAKIAKENNFHGVQIHGAHGYLVSQFLSPKHNVRKDNFGGSLENRMRFAKEIFLQMRKEVGPSFPIGIKLNSADFTQGGFSNEDAVEVAQELSRLGMDLIEISGGSYESPVMIGKVKASTKMREAYFLEYTKKIKETIKCPLMVTGGFRTRAFIEEVLRNNEVDIVGMARPLAVNPNLFKSILRGEDFKNQIHPLSSGFKILDTMFPLEIIWYTHQIHRMGKNRWPDAKTSVYGPILKTAFNAGFAGLRRVRGN